MLERTINRLRQWVPESWRRRLDSYGLINVALNSSEGLKKAYEKVVKTPGGGKLSELEKRSDALSSTLERAEESLNSRNRGPDLGPHKRLETELNKLKQQMEQAKLQQRINHIQQQLAAQVKDLTENRAQLSFQEQQQKQAELQKMQQEVIKLQQNMQEQQKVLDNTESAVKGLQTGFVKAAAALSAAAYADAGLKLDPEAMRANYLELLGRVQDLSPDMAQFIEKNDLSQPSAGNRLLLTALLEKLAPDAALDQSAIATKAKSVLNEFKPAAKKLDLDETDLQNGYDSAIAAKEKTVDTLKTRTDSLIKEVGGLEKQMKGLTPKPGAAKAQEALENEEGSRPSAGPGLTPE